MNMLMYKSTVISNQEKLHNQDIILCGVFFNVNAIFFFFFYLKNHVELQAIPVRFDYLAFVQNVCSTLSLSLFT